MAPGARGNVMVCGIGCPPFRGTKASHDLLQERRLDFVNVPTSALPWFCHPFQSSWTGLDAEGRQVGVGGEWVMKKGFETEDRRERTPRGRE